MDLDYEINNDEFEIDRPQISQDDIHSKHLSNHELDTINKIVIEDHEKNNEKKTLFDLTLNEIIENTIKFLINFNNDFNEIFHELKIKKKINNEYEEEDNDFKLYLYSLMIYISKNDNLIYFGIILIISSIILYFFNIIN